MHQPGWAIIPEAFTGTATTVIVQAQCSLASSETSKIECKVGGLRKAVVQRARALLTQPHHRYEGWSYERTTAFSTLKFSKRVVQFTLEIADSKIDHFNTLLITFLFSEETKVLTDYIVSNLVPGQQAPASRC